MWPGSKFYYDAFLKLSSGRPMGFGHGRISHAATADFGARYGVHGLELDIMWAIITEMDAAYLARVNKDKAKPITPAAKPPAKPQLGR